MSKQSLQGEMYAASLLNSKLERRVGALERELAESEETIRALREDTEVGQRDRKIAALEKLLEATRDSGRQIYEDVQVETEERLERQRRSMRAGFDHALAIAERRLDHLKTNSVKAQHWAKCEMTNQQRVHDAELAAQKGISKILTKTLLCVIDQEKELRSELDATVKRTRLALADARAELTSTRRSRRVAAATLKETRAQLRNARRRAKLADAQVRKLRLQGLACCSPASRFLGARRERSDFLRRRAAGAPAHRRSPAMAGDDIVRALVHPAIAARRQAMDPDEESRKDSETQTHADTAPVSTQTQADATPVATQTHSDSAPAATQTPPELDDEAAAEDKPEPASPGTPPAPADDFVYVSRPASDTLSEGSDTWSEEEIRSLCRSDWGSVNFYA